MSVITKVEPIAKDIEIMLKETLSPAAQSAAFADFAREKLAEGEEINRSVLGRIPPHQTFVDGSPGASEDNVRPDGVIVYEFEIVTDTLQWIAIALEESSPVGGGRDPHPGLYKSSHTLFADGEEISIGDDIPPAKEYVFMNMLPYARKIEGNMGSKPSSRQFPDGVYQVVAKMAATKFSNIAKVTFTWQGVVGGKAIAQDLTSTSRFTSFANRQAMGIGKTIKPGAHNVSDVRFPCISVKPN